MNKKLTKTFLAIPFLLSGMGTAHSLEFGVFSDVTFGKSGVKGENSQFALGALDFYGTTMLDDNTRAFIEYVFEGSDDGLITDLERLWVMRTISDELSIGAGRFHSALGYWNDTYHHGAILQDTISRPFFLEFEDGAGAIIPTHVVGLQAKGRFDFSSSYLKYHVYVANGPSLDTSVASPSDREIEINDTSDPNSDKTVGFRTTFSPNSMDLNVSVFAMSNMIADSGNDGRDLVSQTISGIDLSYQMGDFDLIAEYYNLSNKDELSVGNLGSQTGRAYYAQLGYQMAEAWKVTVRHEAVDTEEDQDRYFKELGVTNEARNVLAVRYDLDETNTLKFEINQRNPEDSAVDDTTAYTVQWSFLIP